MEAGNPPWWDQTIACVYMQCYHPGVQGNAFLRKMVGERRMLVVNALLLPAAALASTFQCCGFLV